MFQNIFKLENDYAARWRPTSSQLLLAHADTQSWHTSLGIALIRGFTYLRPVSTKKNPSELHRAFASTSERRRASRV